jgi:hypothetical protein
MNGGSRRKDGIEVESDQLRVELIEIKERVGALETIASISNRKVVEAYVREHLKTSKGQEIMKECEEPRTREHLMARLGLSSAQALDHHLKPLRANDLIQQRFDEDRAQTFEWSNLFRGLPRSTRDEILAVADSAPKLPGRGNSRQPRLKSSG